MRELLWPRKGFLRPIRYLTMRVLRLSASPHAVAAGVAAGVFVSWTPFIGVHFVMAFVITYFLSGSMVAAAFGNPLTYPFIWGITWEIGHLLLSREDQLAGQTVDLAALFHKLNFTELWKPVLEPMLVGAIPPAIVTSVALYALTFYTVKGFQTRRHIRLMERARLRLAVPAGDMPSV